MAHHMACLCLCSMLTPRSTVWLPDLSALSFLGVFGVTATSTVMCSVGAGQSCIMDQLPSGPDGVVPQAINTCLQPVAQGNLQDPGHAWH
jgi:hypothetical protein